MYEYEKTAYIRDDTQFIRGVLGIGSTTVCKRIHKPV